MSRRRAVVAVVLVAVSVGILAGCTEDGVPADEVVLRADEPVEGVLDSVPPRLAAVGLDTPVEVAADCVTQVEVQPGGTAVDGPRWLVTFTLAAAPVDGHALAATLGEQECLSARRDELERIVAALGAVGPAALDVTYRDPDGRRWLVE